MDRRIPILRILMILALCSTMLQTAWAQDYVAAPVSVSKDKVRRDGKVFYSHVVLEKQTLFSISKAYNVSVEDIYRYNPSVRENGLRKNDILNIPVVETTEQQSAVVEVADKTEAAVPVAQANVPTGQDYRKHTVKWFEDMASIASKYGVSEDAIIKANGLKDRKLKNKQVIIIPSAEPVREVFVKPETKDETPVESAEDNVQMDEDSNIEQDPDTLLLEYWASLIKRNINATLILPFKADGTNSNKNNMDFYSGVLLAAKELSDSDIDLHLNVHDIAVGTSGIDTFKLKGSDLIIGPIAPNDITKIYDLTGGVCPIISPLDQRSEQLTTKYKNLVQVPSSQLAQFNDIAKWIGEDLQEGDKVIVISEKEARQNDAGRILRTIMDRSRIEYTPFAYSILEGRDIQETLEAVLTAEGVNRVVIASESEAFVNDAVRNLNLVVHNMFPVVLYAPSKIRSFETIEVENFHNTQLHASLTYNIDYDDPKVQIFIRRYRAMFGTEPTQFAYQGYDITRYFVNMVAKYQDDWMSYLIKEDSEMLQSSFEFRNNGHGSYINNGIRRIVYGNDYSIEEVL